MILENVDFDLLNKQRLMLVELIWEDKGSDLWGLVSMLDDICDRAGVTE